MRLAKHLVEKPWGRMDVPASFGETGGRRIGEVWYESEDANPLPLLVKWLFTSEKLSVQVHPDDAQAAARGMPSGKEECWYIVAAEPGAVLGMGTCEPLDVDRLRAASLSGEIEALMDWKPVAAGDYFYIPAGTVHAVGAGITLVEVQQYADITYRLYDYGRPRELHLDDAVAVSRAVPYADPRSGRASGNRRLVDGPHFWLDHVVDAEALLQIGDEGPYWVAPVAGGISAGSAAAAAGDCLLLDRLDDIAFDPSTALLVAGVCAK